MKPLTSSFILSLNDGHNSSIAYTLNGDIQLAIETERINRIKYSDYPYEALRYITHYTDTIDMLGIAGMKSHTKPTSYSDHLTNLKKGCFNTIQEYDSGLLHHKMHSACAFYNSGFKKALVIVSDGMGSDFYFTRKSDSESFYGREHTSSYIWEYPSKAICVDKKVSFPFKLDFDINIKEYIEINDTISPGEAFSVFALYCGFHVLDAGKIMGLASYGKENKDIPPIYVNGVINNSLFVIQNKSLHNITLNWNGTSFQEKADFAYALQKETQEHMCDYIQAMVKKSGINTVCLTGGYFLNCVANAYIRKTLKDIELYVEPISSDAGTSIGTSKFLHHSITGDCIIRKQKTIYYGLTHSYTQNNIQELAYDLNVIKVTPQEVAQKIKENNIVCLYQGRSENGPRALGNRSMLYNPCDPNGKDFVNTIKRREHFRPFAGTVLLEYANEYFDMLDMKESPFMIYALDVKQPEKIPAITHINNTCRIQTVTQEQNKHYYNLINEFYNLTGVPILFNTSFNLAGDPIVETLEDAIQVIRKTSIKYLYLPEYETFITKRLL